MAGNLFTVTDAGRAALVSPGNTGTAAHKVTQIGVSTVAFDSTDKTLKVLPGERKRITTLAGDNVAADMIHVTLKDDTDDQYTLYGFGLYFENGVLFGTYSQATPIMEKSPAAMLLLAADMAFKSIDTAQISFGDATFTNPPATTDRQGVVQLATNAQAIAGTDTQRAVTPAGLQSALAPALATKSNVGHRHTIVEVDGLQSALDAKLNLTGGILRGNTTVSNATLAFQNGNYTASMRADASGLLGFLNQALTAWNLQLNDAGVLSLPRARPNWAGGLTPWDNGNFDPNTRVAKTGDRMSGDLFVDSGGLHLSGWNGNPNTGVVFLNAASNRYVNFDGTSYVMPGAELYTGPAINRVWHAGNFNPAAYQPAGNYQPAGSYQAAGDYLRNRTGQTTTGLYFGSANPPGIGGISQSGNNDNVALTIGNDGNQSASAVMQFHRQGSFAAYFGLDTDNQWAVGGRSMGNVRYRLFHEGNFDPNTAVNLANNANNNAASKAPIRNGNNNGGYGYVCCDSTAKVTISWDGANHQIYADNSYLGALMTTSNYNNWAATKSAQVQWGSGVSELAGVVTGADVTVDAGGPWVLEGLRTVGGNNRIYMRVVWLRNQ
ncbi:hypothetical protein ABH944_002490 [Caballeronia udeis]|uniref:Phage-related tail fiber protein n=2 Tax=Caballeronia udeis TaxID=1232866 RepID=A0A158GAM6_9BURK|nr:phage-related tail fiber protein [Caballeronia udeis]